MPSTVFVKHTPRGKRKEREDRYPEVSTLVWSGVTVELDGGGVATVRLPEGMTVSYNNKARRLVVWYEEARAEGKMWHAESD